MTKKRHRSISPNQPQQAPSQEWFDLAVRHGTISVARNPATGSKDIRFDSDSLPSLHELRDLLNEQYAGGALRFGVQIACRFAVWFAYQVLVDGHRPGIMELALELGHLPDRGPGRVESHPDRSGHPPHARIYRDSTPDRPKIPRPHKPRVYPPRPAFELPHLRKPASSPSAPELRFGDEREDDERAGNSDGHHRRAEGFDHPGQQVWPWGSGEEEPQEG